MRKPLLLKTLAACVVLLCAGPRASSQRFLSDYDSTLFIRDTLRPFLKRLENLHFSGYLQPQFQVAQQQGADSYAGGNFSEFSDNRFMLRRARIKFDYILPAGKGHIPGLLFTFQIDATERGVNVRDMFMRLYEPKGKNFSLATGIFARPFGYELTFSSSSRETPERGRMSQILMPTERDLGAMITYESQKRARKAASLKWDIGLFNGQGLVGKADFDSYKDLISRLTLKPVNLSQIVAVSGGLSLLYGGWRQATQYRYQMGIENNTPVFVLDSSEKNRGAKAPRHYYGADVQLTKKSAWGKTELRGEYWRGTQPGTATSTTNPGELPTGPTYIRQFDGAFFYFLQQLGSDKWEVMAKYDWYDPNTKAKTTEIGKPATNLTAADVKFATFGLGLTRYINDHLKILVYYDWVQNEKTSLSGYTSDRKDNIFTCRMQVRF